MVRGYKHETAMQRKTNKKKKIKKTDELIKKKATLQSLAGSDQ